MSIQRPQLSISNYNKTTIKKNQKGVCSAELGSTHFAGPPLRNAALDC